MDRSPNVVEMLVRQLDDAYRHPFESLTSALEEVTEADAFRVPAAYAAEEPEEGWPAPGTIAWQVAHVTHCKRHYADCLASVGAPERPPVRPWTRAVSLEALRNLLAAAHAEERAALAALRAEDLALPLGGGMTVGEFATMAIRHDAWHASQIAVARRLLRHERG